MVVLYHRIIQRLILETKSKHRFNFVLSPWMVMGLAL